MKTKVYSTFAFDGEPLWDKVPEGSLDFSHWDAPAHYNTCFQMCFVKNRGIFLRMHTDETAIRMECTSTDEAVYEDSCMEFFVAPLEGREEYINFEMNPRGVYLSEYGKGKQDRVYLKTLTDKTPVITAKSDDKGWSLELFVPCLLISEAYGVPFTAEKCRIKGNFYKCGDKTEKLHYDAYNEMTTLPPGFHNPFRFAEIIVEDYV